MKGVDTPEATVLVSGYCHVCGQGCPGKMCHRWDRALRHRADDKGSSPCTNLCRAIAPRSCAGCTEGKVMVTGAEQAHPRWVNI